MNRGFNHGQQQQKQSEGTLFLGELFGNTPSLIDTKKTLRWASQNTRGVITKEKDPNLTAGIENIIKLQVGIAALQEKNTELNQFAFRDQYAKAYQYHTTSSRHSFSYSSETPEGTYFKMGGTVITAVDRWTHRMHKSGQDSTGVGRWYWYTVLCKHNVCKIKCTLFIMSRVLY
jgi:hypothetical protein